MATILSHIQVCQQIEWRIRQAGSLRLAADTYKVSPQYLSAVLLKQRAIGPKLLRALKLRRKVIKTVTYEATRGRA